MGFRLLGLVYWSIGGKFFTKPVLSVYELNVAFGQEKWRDVYLMDFYTVQSGRWSNYHEENRNRQIRNE